MQIIRRSVLPMLISTVARGQWGPMDHWDEFTQSIRKHHWNAKIVKQSSQDTHKVAHGCSKKGMQHSTLGNFKSKDPIDMSATNATVETITQAFECAPDPNLVKKTKHALEKAEKKEIKAAKEAAKDAEEAEKVAAEEESKAPGSASALVEEAVHETCVNDHVWGNRVSLEWAAAGTYQDADACSNIPAHKCWNDVYGRRVRASCCAMCASCVDDNARVAADSVSWGFTGADTCTKLGAAGCADRENGNVVQQACCHTCKGKGYVAATTTDDDGNPSWGYLDPHQKAWGHVTQEGPYSSIRGQAGSGTLKHPSRTHDGYKNKKGWEWPEEDPDARRRRDSGSSKSDGRRRADQNPF